MRDWLEEIKQVFDETVGNKGSFDKLGWPEHIGRLIDRVEELENKYDEQLDESQKTYDYFKREIERYKQALEFYANEKNYETDVINQWEPVRPIMKDNGGKARQALEREE